MGKGSSIDLGLPTEAKPEWTISLDFTENEKKKEEEKKETAAKPASSLFNDALDSDFLNEDFSKESGGSFLGGGLSGGIGTLDEKISSSHNEEEVSGSASANDSLLGGIGGEESLSGGGDDSLTTLGGGADSTLETDTIIGVPSRENTAGTVTNAGNEIENAESSTAAVQAVVEQFSASMQAVVQQLSATVQAVEHSAEHREEPSHDSLNEPVAAAVDENISQPESEDDAEVLQSEQDIDSWNEPVAAAVDENISQPESEDDAEVLRSEQDIDSWNEPAAEPVLPEGEIEKEKEVDEVDERLSHLANSMDNWEQSENALSEAAAMLSNEEKISGESESEDHNDELRNLLDRLQVSDSIDRMTATLQEDRADVIEQTEKDNELEDAVEAVLVDETTINPEPQLEEMIAPEFQPAEELEQIEELSPVPEPDAQETPEWTMDLVQEELPEPVETEVSPEENFMSSEMEITNDMFDLGYDLSGEESDYSDENIDLSQFKGSIDDADEFDTKPENSIDLDEAEADRAEKDGIDFDMSNLVAAAMNDLTASHVSEDEPDGTDMDYSDSFMEADTSEEAAPEPEESEESLSFMSIDEPDGTEQEGNLDFATSDQSEDTDGSLSFMSMDEPDGTEQEGNLDFTTSDQSEDTDGSLSFMSIDEPDGTEQEGNLDFATSDQSEDTDGSLSFMSMDEPDGTEQEGNLDFAIDDQSEDTDGSLSFITDDEPEESEGSLSFMTEDEQSALNSDLALEFAAAEEVLQEPVEQKAENITETPAEISSEETQKEWSADSEWIAQTESNSQPEEIKLEFEPVFPDGAVPTISGMMDDMEGDDIGSLIIEDYSEVPTVSDLENKLKKNEKEKRKHKSKESQKKKEDGFAFSLDDVGSQINNANEAQPPKENHSDTDVAAAALKTAEETVAATQIKTPPENSSSSIVTTVYAKQNIRKIGKIKRTYFSLYYQ